MTGLVIPVRIGALASGGGSNLQAIIDQCENGGIPAEVVCIISNNSSSGALDRAEKHGIPHAHMSSVTHPDTAELDRAVCNFMAQHGVTLVALCGYMKKLGSTTLSTFTPYILNVHPALLPAHGGKGMYGLNVHEAVIAAGETVSGVTVHLVNEAYDTGPILAQRKVPVVRGDTPEDLQKRVLIQEHRLYTEVIKALGDGTVRIVDGEPTQVLG